MSTNEPMSDERLAEARAALDEDMSQWGGEYGLELIAEVERLRALTTVDDDMVERAKRAFGAATAQVSSVPLGMSEGMFIDSVGLQHQHAIRAALEAALNPGATITINDAGTGGCTLIATGTARGRHATR